MRRERPHVPRLLPVGLIAEDHLGALKAGQVPRLPCRDGCERVRRCGVRRGRVRDVPGPGVHEWSVHLVREDPAAVPLHHLGRPGHLVQRKHAAQRVVRAAEDEQVPADPERGVDPVQVQGEEPFVVVHLDLDDLAADQAWHDQERHVGRRRQDDRPAGPGEAGEPGREKCVIAISSALITSGTGWTDPPSTPHPNRRCSKSAHAAASSSASRGGRYPKVASAVSLITASTIGGAAPKSISATAAPNRPGPDPAAMLRRYLSSAHTTSARAVAAMRPYFSSPTTI